MYYYKANYPSMKNKVILPLLITIVSLALLQSCKKEMQMDCQSINLHPKLEFISPVDGAAIQPNSNNSLKVSMSEDSGQVTRMKFYIAGKYIGSTSTFPASINWTAQEGFDGIQKLKAEAYSGECLVGSTEINVNISSNKIYFGDFQFKVVTWNWGAIPLGNHFDTTYYDGIIRQYVIKDSDEDLLPYNYDKSENPKNKITIEFYTNQKVTSILKSDGSLKEKLEAHYNLQGSFIGYDSINFKVLELGGLGGGYDHYVSGKRK